MVPSRSLWEQISNLIAADATTLANATANKVSLVVANFVPSLDLALSGLTLASFTGSTAIAAGTGTQDVFYDPVTGLRKVVIKPPAGGWKWICTATPSPAQTIYGWVLTDGAIANLLASGLLQSPIPISSSGQGIELNPLTLSFLLTSPQ